MLPATRTVEAAGDYGYRSPARTASPLTELEAWMDADTRRTASRASKGAAAASSPSSIMASPRSGAAPPASPTSRHAFMRSTETALGAAVRRYPTEVARSPATVRSSSATAAVLPTGLAPGRTLSRARTSSAAADFGYDLGPATSGTITVPEIVEMRRIVDRRNTARDRNIGIGSPAAATDKVGLSADPFADTPAYVSPYRTASAGSGPTPSSAISRSTSAYESPVAYAAPRGSGLRTGDELFRVPAALAGTEISEVVRDYTRTGGVLNGASSLGALDAPVDTTADALLERLKEEQWQRERKGHGTSTSPRARARALPLFCARMPPHLAPR
jgi:hypothetical protein